jgi:hypothetical protein
MGDVQHVVIFQPEHLSARDGRPRVSVAVEARDRPGPAFKHGVASDDVVWIRMGPLLVAKAVVDIAYHFEYAMLKELRERTKGTELYGLEGFWAGKPKVGYAVVAKLRGARFVPEAKLAGPRTYGYDWIVLENERKEDTWLDERAPEPKDAQLVSRFRAMLLGEGI